MADQAVSIAADLLTAEMINLPTGKALNAEQATMILRNTGAPVVVLAGAVGSGKTTLVASLYDSFQRGSFAGYLAAGSDTLIAFEERCFDSRSASGAEVPSTLRTPIDEGHLFYHLRLRAADRLQGPRHLLIADMSGEYYERALDSASEARALEEIVCRADQFVHLIDAAKLASKEFRTNVRSNASMLMRRFFELRYLRDDARVDILLTKWDLVLASGGEGLCTEIHSSATDFFQQQCAGRVRRLRIRPIAARPHYLSAIGLAFGLSDLLQTWVEEIPRHLETQPRRLPVPVLHRPFDRFALCEAKELYEVASSE
jgi:hypothetical protein